ncbi:MAG: UvrD-helicase domain-containing protein [Bacteroidota bacterium]
MDKTFYVYRSSAGSGKTRTLAKEYIKLALRWEGDYFKYILAVTFANKATQEMKERILHYLNDFANNRPNNLSREIQEELNLDAQQLQRQSQLVLSNILHHYSQFAISTIDAFFQRVIRSFTREAGLLGNFRLEVDHEMVLDEVLASLMDELGHNHQLTQWVVQFSRDRLKEGDNWDVMKSLRGFLQEIFKEQFKAIETQVVKPDWSADDHQRILNVLNKEVAQFMQFMKTRAQQAMAILARNNISIDDFNFKDQGTAYKYFNHFSQGIYVSAEGQRLQGALVSSADWPSRKSRNAGLLKSLAEQELMPLLNEMVSFDKKNLLAYKSAEKVLENYYAFGLITDVTRKLREYKEENNLMLLSDASQFLNGIINDSDTPFIYEKVGSYFKNYLIDEFQDTSGFQWKNFVPLLKEASDQGNANLIVGDVKQSIYRWRGGDLELLQSEVVKEFGENRVAIVPLNTNYRSAGRVIDFNNLFFQQAVTQITEAIAHPLPAEVYNDVNQNVSRLPDQGFVRVHFMEDEEGDDWKEQTLRTLPGWLEQLQDAGAALKDIAILVRTNGEGQRIANYLLQFRHSADAKEGYRYDVISNESLRLDSALSVNIIITAIRYLKNPDDAVARGQLAFEVSQHQGLDQLFVKAKARQLEDLLPVEFLQKSRQLLRLSLFELSEELVRIFQLGKQTEELAYLQAFQDAVLEFSAREKTDIGSFLEWWEIYKEKKSIQVSASVNAVNILTIHKSKGLQFKFVIVPFCDWALNHEGFKSPLLWVDSDCAPFNQLGKVAVKYGNDLKNTLFEDDFRNEYTKVHLDNLNLLYVAFTRAEHGLIVFTKGKDSRLTTVGDLVYRSVGNSTLQEKIKNGTLEWGEIAYESEQGGGEDTAMIELKEYTSHDWRTKLVIKRQGAEFFDDETSERRSKINRGILVHQVLSRIEYKAQAEEVLAQFLLETALPEDEALRLKEDVAALLAHPQIGAWFTKDWKVKTEALVLLPGFEQKRIDRIMFGHNRTVLVDYKTGKKKTADKDQVEKYGHVLAQMGYPNVQAYLVYLDDLRVEEVINKSNLSLF